MKLKSESNFATCDWYCIRCKPRSEKLAAFHLQKLEDVAIFLPRTQRVRKSQSVVSSEKPLFPGYIFAQFEPGNNLRAVNYCLGVSYVVKRDQKPVKVPAEVIAELNTLGADGVLDIVDLPHRIGDDVQIIKGLFRGGEGKIVRLAPARERIKVLFEILGRKTEVEISEEDIDFPSSNPMTVTN